MEIKRDLYLQKLISFMWDGQVNKRWYDDNGILNIGIMEYLLDDGIV